MWERVCIGKLVPQVINNDFLWLAIRSVSLVGVNRVRQRRYLPK